MLACLAGVLAHPCCGALVWAKTIVELDLAARPENATAVFSFRNEGDTPVRIAMVISSCDCVAARQEKETYAPGEIGAITAVFKAEGATGNLQRTIAIVTDVARESPTILTLKIRLPAARKS